MKVFIIDNKNKFIKLKNKLEELLDIEVKEDENFKVTKNDVVIVSELKEEYKKISKLILLTNTAEPRVIWEAANYFNALDIIKYNENNEEIANRIYKILLNKKIVKVGE